MRYCLVQLPSNGLFRGLEVQPLKYVELRILVLLCVGISQVRDVLRTKSADRILKHVVHHLVTDAHGRRSKRPPPIRDGILGRAVRPREHLVRRNPLCKIELREVDIVRLDLNGEDGLHSHRITGRGIKAKLGVGPKPIGNITAGDLDDKLKRLIRGRVKSFLSWSPKPPL